jgi:Icc-related predicted phosphoesterase
MRILHISDTHGRLPDPVGDFDVIVHSGDFMPNRSWGIRPIEYEFQRYWLEQNAPKFSPRYWAKPLLICPGNHDYVDPVPILKNLGIDARTLCNNAVEVDDVSFYGHPWTPTFYDWNWMCGSTEMRLRLSGATELMNQGGIDVFVAHGPMYGVLDRNAQGERCGCRVLRETMRDVRHPPKLLLHGHIHESAGIVGWSRGMVVSNAACTQRILELKQ